MKEQTRNTQDQLNKEEMGKLPEKEFRIMITETFQNLENRMERCKNHVTRLTRP